MSATKTNLSILVGNRVWAMREAKGLSQIELARRAKIGRPFLNQFETGKHMPSLDTLWKVAEALGCDYRKLLPAPNVVMRLEGKKAKR